MVSDADVVFGLRGNEVLSKGNIQSLSGVMRLLKACTLILSGPVHSYIDLHTTRTLWLSASSLATI
jgi:hypothetical protein